LFGRSRPCVSIQFRHERLTAQVNRTKLSRQKSIIRAILRAFPAIHPAHARRDCCTPGRITGFPEEQRHMLKMRVTFGLIGAATIPVAACTQYVEGGAARGR
jgi:hypothetical protein